MEDRLLKLLDTEQLSSSKFADVIGVQRSSVSHILTGRNKPSFDFLQKTLKAFPMLNADWLILGEGEMYEGDRGPGGGSLFDQPAPVAPQAESVSVPGSAEKPAEQVDASPAGSHIAEPSAATEENTPFTGGSTQDPADQQTGGEATTSDALQPGNSTSGTLPQAAALTESQQVSVTRQPERRVRRVILFYDDNSFEAYDQA